ncbi:hypothetical protein V6N13_023985 [Hibiscus sabdariffa]|uniref:Uncharacterized protein n=1 Tax=Hibiscus sabdariffa TaxID=183260 RepID=A0ABR2PNF7_9ROSI
MSNTIKRKGKERRGRRKVDLGVPKRCRSGGILRRALLRDNKVENLSRMYRFYCKKTRGLVIVVNIFEQHVIGLLLRVQPWFNRRRVLPRLLRLCRNKSFCNKTVAGSSSAELSATFHENFLNKGGSEKLSDEEAPCLHQCQRSLC